MVHVFKEIAMVLAQLRPRRSIVVTLTSMMALVGVLVMGPQPAGAAVGDPVTPTILKDIEAGANDSSPAFYVEKDGELFFLTFGDTSGFGAPLELWKTNGTAAGTVLVKAVGTGNGLSFFGGNVTARLTLVGGTLFFAANDGTHGMELWKSDGTEAGTVMVKDIYDVPANFESQPTHFVPFGSLLLFKTTYDPVGGSELWRSDGTEAGTFRIKDINTQPCPPFSSLCANSGSSTSNADAFAVNAPTNLVVAGTTAYFTATNGINGAELWKTDGTEAGTAMVKDINTLPTVSAGSNPANLAVVGSTVYFSANDGAANISGTHGTELWKSDGTEAGTVLVKDINANLNTFGGGSGSSPANLTALGSTLLFAATDGITGSELWKSDGTEAGTVQVKNINTTTPTASGGASQFSIVGSTAYFVASDGTTAGMHGSELWKTDGTESGTVLVKDINPGTASSLIGTSAYNNTKEAAVVGAELYFTADDGTNGLELWKTDGTEVGTTLTKDIVAGAAGPSASMLAPGLGTLFFSADNGAKGVEPWLLSPSPLPSLRISDLSVTEGDAGTTTAVLTVTRSGATNLASTVSWKTGGGPATVGTDYSPVTSTPLAFGAGESSKTVSVDVAGDTAPEKDETFTVVLLAPVGAVLADASGTVTIRNDDGAAYVAAGNLVVAEGGTGDTTPAVFTVTRTGNTTSSSTVKAKISGGNAIAGTDYTPVPETTLSFVGGETEKTVSVDVLGDVAPEGNETFNLVLFAPSLGTTLADASATAYIDDDDGSAPAPASQFFSVNSLSLSEGHAGPTSAAFTVTRSGNISAAATVSYKTLGGTATGGGTDYTSVVGGLVSFAAGDPSEVVTIDVTGDTAPEKDETFNVVLSGQPPGSVLADPSGTATILNDDGASYLSVSNAQVAEGGAGTVVVTITVTRSGSTTSAATASAKSLGGNAAAGTDYTAISGVPVSFAAGETSATVTVDVTGDVTPEPNETFNVVLSAPGPGVTLSDPSGTVTILNDD